MKTYLLLRNNKQSGPYTLDEMLTMGLRSQDLIWIEGKSASWRYPSELDEFKGLVAAPVLEDPLDIGFTQVQNTIVHSMPPSVLPVEPSPALEMNGFPTLTSFMRESGDRDNVKRPLIFVAADITQEVPSAVFQTLAGTDDSLEAMPTMAWQAAPSLKVENSNQHFSPQGSPETTALAEAPETAKPLVSKILVTLPAAVPDKTLVVIGRKSQPVATPQPSKPLIRRPVLEFITEPESSIPLTGEVSAHQHIKSGQVESMPIDMQETAEPAVTQHPMASEIVETKPLEEQDQMEPAVLIQSLTEPQAQQKEYHSVAAAEEILQQVPETVINRFARTVQSNAFGVVSGSNTSSTVSLMPPGLSVSSEGLQDHILSQPPANSETVDGAEEPTDSILANLAVTVPAGEPESYSTLRVSIRTIQKFALTTAILSLIAVMILIANSIFNPDAYNYQNLPQQQVPVKADTQPVREGTTGTAIEESEGQKSTDASSSSTQQRQASPTDDSDILPVVNHEK